MNLGTLLLATLALPLLGSVVARCLPARMSGAVATAAIVGSFVASVPVAQAALAGSTTAIDLGGWISTGSTDIRFQFVMTALTAFMTLIITGVGGLIHIFSCAYMAPEVRRHRFFSYLNLFIFFMLVLVLGGSLPVTFIGWEGVGLCSYLLISFWFENDAFAKAGRKAFIVNRIGDVGLLVAMFALMANGQSLDAAAYQQPVAQSDAQLFGLPLWNVVAFGLLLGAVGKSAQIPLFVWLPDAMAGPTPVSALIHAATMVTAGVFLAVQYGAIFEAAPAVMQLMGWLAALTALYGALVAMTKYDIKKVLAYSTVSQLGLMFLGVASGTESGALFHVLTHAFFKACLFLGAGAVIFGCHHEQDIRKMGGLLKLMPITAATFAIASITAAGVPPFGGFYSKGLIIEAAATHTWWFIIAEVVSCCTALYMTRLFCTVFLGSFRGGHAPHEVSPIMTMPLVVLALLATVIGVLLDGGGSLAATLHISAGATHPLSVSRDMTHAWPALLGISLGFLGWRYGERLGAALHPLREPIEKGFGIDEFYEAAIVAPLRGISTSLLAPVERAVQAIGGFVARVTFLVTGILQHAQNGEVRLYGLLLLFGTGMALIFIS